MLSEKHKLIMARYLLNIYEKQLESVYENYQYISSIKISSKTSKINKWFLFRIFQESFIEQDIRRVESFFQKESEKTLKEYKEIYNIIFLLKSYITKCNNKKMQESFFYLVSYLELSNREKTQTILNKLWKDYLDEQKGTSLTTLELDAKFIKIR